LDRVDLSQAAVARAFDLSQSVLATQREVEEERKSEDVDAADESVVEVENVNVIVGAAALQYLSAASDREENDDREADQSASGPRRSTRSRPDVNYVAEDEDESDYESLSSEASEGDGYDDVENDDV
jgi:hypothetical protein